jgi:glycosyltransferase involved in cell wall biosynthesis
MEVTGRVPDVRPYLERGSAFIVPMRVGGGTRLKIYEAMSMGLPVISTSIGAEGLPVTDGETAVLRDDARSFADATVRLLENDEERRRVAEAGQGLVRARFGWGGVADAFMETCASVVEARSRSREKRALTSLVQGA